MTLPFDSTTAEILQLGPVVYSGTTPQYVSTIHVKDGGSWKKAQQIYIKRSGSWSTVYTADIFTFSVQVDGNSTSGFDLPTWLTNGGYVSPTTGSTWNGSQPVRGRVIINAVRGGSPGVNIGTLPSGSLIYLIVNSNCRIQGPGGNGGNVGSNGGGGGTALYTRTSIAINNAGAIWGGGGGGGGGQDGTCSGTYTYYYGCGKGSTCSGTGTYYYGVSGGSGGGGAGYPAGSGGTTGYGGGNGTDTSGGGGGGNAGCGSTSGASGGGPGESGSNSTYTGGSAGAYIDGGSYVYNWVANGDRRGPNIN